jgi:hypothetical protein
MGLSRTGNIGNDWKSGPVSSSLDRRAGRITSMNRRTFLQTAGLSPHSVKEKYYFARFQQRVNRVVDIAPWVERKIDLNLENKAQGPAGENGQRLRARLEAQGQRLPLLGSDDAGANRNYIRRSSCSRIGSLASATGSPMPNGSTTSVLRRITWRNTFERTPYRGSQSTL